MMAISFAWTTDALLAQRKTCTRRAWTAKHAAKFHKGDLVWGLNKSFQFGGRRIALIELMRAPYVESTADMPEEDYEAEGLAWMEEKGLSIRGQHPREFWDNWRAEAQLVNVVRFDPVALECNGSVWVRKGSVLFLRPMSSAGEIATFLAGPAK